MLGSHPQPVEIRRSRTEAMTRVLPIPVAECLDALTPAGDCASAMNRADTCGFPSRGFLQSGEAGALPKG
jgi:hypothetical protein